MSSRQNFTINGKAVSVEVPANTPLMFVIRNDLGMKGTRHGCAEGECGACTVLVDGQPVTSCDLPVDAVAGKTVETIEGMAAAGHPLLEAFISHQAGQCAYCLAGILMRAKALLESNGATTRAQIAAGLDEHLCRCGAHPRILDAIASVAQQRTGGALADSNGADSNWGDNND